MRFLFASQQGSSAAPVVSSVSASTGEDWDTTTSHTITGTGFANGCTCTIGGVSTTSLAFVNSTTLTVTMPARTLASTVDTLAVDVVVTNPDTQTSGASGASAFTYTWTPYSLAPIAMYRADRGLTKAGTSLSKWANVGGSGGTAYDLTPPTGNPTWNSVDANFNGQSSITFGVRMATGTISLAAPQTFIMIGRTHTTLGNIAMSDQAGSHWIFDNATGATAGLFAGSVLASGVSWQNTSAMIMATFNAASSQIYFNNSTTGVTGNPGANVTFTEITLGGNHGGAGFLGEICEFIVLPALPSAGDRALLKAYVNTRYALTVA